MSYKAVNAEDFTGLLIPSSPRVFSVPTHMEKEYTRKKANTLSKPKTLVLTCHSGKSKRSLLLVATSNANSGGKIYEKEIAPKLGIF